MEPRAQSDVTVSTGGHEPDAPGPRLPSFRWAIGLFLISSVLVLIVGSAVQALDPALGLAFTEVALILAPALVAARLQRLDLVETFSLRRPSVVDLLLSMVAGVSGWLLVSQGTDWLIDLAGADQRTLAALRPIAPAMVVVMAVFPACEEVLFRGYVFAGLRSRYRPTAAIVCTAILFAAYHQDPTRIPGALVLGLLFGAALIRTGSLFAAMAMHVTSNLCAGLLSRASWAIEAAPWWQLLAAGSALLLALALMGRARRPEPLPAPEQPRRPVVFLGLGLLLVAGCVVALPHYLDLLVWQQVVSYGGTVQVDRYRMRDDFSFRKETTILLWGDGVGQWTDQGHALSLPAGDRLVSAEIAGHEVGVDRLPEGRMALSLHEPVVAGTVVEVVSEGRLDPAGPHRFPSHPFVPVIALRATIDLRGAPALRFRDSGFRVQTPMFITYPRVDDWASAGGWVEAPLVRSRGVAGETAH